MSKLYLALSPPSHRVETGTRRGSESPLRVVPRPACKSATEPEFIFPKILRLFILRKNSIGWYAYVTMQYAYRHMMWSEFMKSFYIKTMHKHFQQYVWSPWTSVIKTAPKAFWSYFLNIGFSSLILAFSELHHPLFSLDSCYYMILHLITTVWWVTKKCCFTEKTHSLRFCQGKLYKM